MSQSQGKEFKTVSVKPGDRFFVDCPTTPNALVERSKQNSQHMKMLLAKREAFLALLGNRNLPSKIIAENMSPQETDDFFAGFSALLELNKKSDVEDLGEFLRSSEMRIRGNAHLLKFLREYNVENEKNIKEVILTCLRTGR
ncbi:MAG: hypothetical protein US25_C0078G0004 [Candidatus Moranbacteria bacterium GW2011_GWE1_36_7]|nr:MAG: hypothetical protein UR99_C0068G0004 [Candidatus Moranbacteria bacterium GW2011_GWD2_36_12]KKQ04472.1 MAG: hypothetical protein US16_C0058G0004 [Candidatus Moranbacteria bacterium GW2011_GWE2_36_40]KKQ11633.1 MAG: hypothetical protein US25_C0078G0004 [Candidatus Moranbacteria bacterium GW2011_GWE1_36_7]